MTNVSFITRTKLRVLCAFACMNMHNFCSSSKILSCYHKCAKVKNSPCPCVHILLGDDKVSKLTR